MTDPSVIVRLRCWLADLLSGMAVAVRPPAAPRPRDARGRFVSERTSAGPQPTANCRPERLAGFDDWLYVREGYPVSESDAAVRLDPYNSAMSQSAVNGLGSQSTNTGMINQGARAHGQTSLQDEAAGQYGANPVGQTTQTGSTPPADPWAFFRDSGRAAALASKGDISGPCDYPVCSVVGGGNPVRCRCSSPKPDAE